MFKSMINHAGMIMRRAILGILHLLGSLVGHCLYFSRCGRCHYARINLKLCFPSLKSREINRLTRQSLRETGKLLFEVMFFWLCPGRFYQGLIRRVVGEEHLLRARAEGCGIILVGPHLGNWEVFNAYAGRMGAYVSYKPLSGEWMNRWIRRCRECNGSRLLPIGNEGLKVLCAGLDEGKVVVMFPDQVPKAGGRVMVPFFGVSAWTGTLVSRLAGKKKVRVICGYARRLPRAQGFEIHLQAAPDGIYLENTEMSAAALNRGMEDCIRRSPEQYIWTYKRFKDTACKELYHRRQALT
jgi:Kdo2-lipid IVA lauroyltransferase/acyltransferase